MDISLEKLKRRVLRGFVREENLMRGLVLKGGSALQVYNLINRASIDIDFSTDKDFTQDEIIRLKRQIKFDLNSEFEDLNLCIIDLKFEEKPKQGKIKEWKGYRVEFKIVEKKRFDELQDKMNLLRNKAIVINKNTNSTKFIVDISPFEYIEKSTMIDIDGAVLRIYTLEMIVLEKVRALCQSLKEYLNIIPTARDKKRAKDFYDIYRILMVKKIDFTSNDNKQLLEDIFNAKRVPTKFLSKLKNSGDQHKPSWDEVLGTLPPEEMKTAEENGFDYYFSYTIDHVIKPLET